MTSIWLSGHELVIDPTGPSGLGDFVPSRGVSPSTLPNNYS